MKNENLKTLLPLVVICLVAALLLGVFNQITEGPIRENSQKAAMETRQRLLPAASSFEEQSAEDSGLMSLYRGLNDGGETVGYVAETAVNGFGGEIVVTVGMGMDGTITAISVGGDNFSETAGLGALAKEASFTDQFQGRSVPLTVVKGNADRDDTTIDAISGATVTSSAVNNGVNAAGAYMQTLLP